MSYEAGRIRRVVGRVIEVEHLDLPKTPQTRLNAAAAAAATTLTVLDNSQFGDPHFALIRPLGTQRAEIGDITGVTGATTINLNAGVTFAHSAGEEVFLLAFNQWNIYGTTTTTFSTDNVVASGIAMDVSQPFTTYINTGTEYTYYWARPYDSIDAVNGAESDPVASATGYVSNSVQNLINHSLTDSHTKLGGKIDFEYLLAKLNQGMEYIRGKLKRFSSLQTFDSSLGQTTRGAFNFTMPTDAYDRNTNRSILGVYVGTGTALEYRDKREFEEDLEGVVRTQVRTQAVANDTTLDIDNSYDFADSGTVTVYVSGTAYDITYTGVTRSTTVGVLTGVPASGTGSITVTIPVDTNVWQDEEEGKPTGYTVYDGSLYIYPLPDASYDNLNLTMDYYTGVNEVNSAADTLDIPRFNLLRNWLTWQLRSLKNQNGQPDMNDGDFKLFQDTLRDMIFQELNGSGQKYKRRPKRYNLTGSNASNAV